MKSLQDRTAIKHSLSVIEKLHKSLGRALLDINFMFLILTLFWKKEGSGEEKIRYQPTGIQKQTIGGWFLISWIIIYDDMM